MDIRAYCNFIKPVVSAVLCVISFFTSLFGMPTIPHGKEIDMSKYELTWSDEFDGNSLNFNNWDSHGFEHGNTIVRRGSYWNTDMASVRDGSLHIATKYYENGLNGNGKPGWYTCGIDTSRCIMQAHGYFECRCILPKGSGEWAAFWMTTNTVGDKEYFGTNGLYGAEIDVFESPFFDKKLRFNRNAVSGNIHIDGYGEEHKSENAYKSFVPGNNPYEQFNTYGVAWTEDEYIFYVNGVETGRTKFGVSCVPEYFILSVEVGGENAVPADSWAGVSIENSSVEPTDFVVDYVRAYRPVEK